MEHKLNIFIQSLEDKWPLICTQDFILDNCSFSQNVASPVIIPEAPQSTEHLVEPSSWGFCSCDHSFDGLHLEELLFQVLNDEEHQTGQFHDSCDQLSFP